MLPAWLTHSNGGLSGTPTATDVDTYEIKVTATDEQGASASLVFNLEVNGRPVSGGLQDQTIDDEFFFSFGVTPFTDPDGDELTYELLLPGGEDWMRLDQDALAVYGIGQEVADENNGSETHTVTLRVTDEHGAFAEDTFDLTVNDVAQRRIVRRQIRHGDRAQGDQPDQMPYVPGTVLEHAHLVIADPLTIVKAANGVTKRLCRRRRRFAA